ncbi:MAG TPA: SDR family oxidoreductase [Rhodocyclaceae bacterium]|nr:SDR family oxidoreductase [Rhodocyclaceae bacterium]
MNVLVTGAGGFVGQRLCAHLGRSGWRVRQAHRLLPRASRLAPGSAQVQVGEIGLDTDWRHALDGMESVVHLAARVHVTKDASPAPLAEFRRVNVMGTDDLARQSAAAGVRRFVYLSSVKVNGESTQPGRAFTALDAPAPEDPYGISKSEAEKALRRIADKTGMEVVIVRPPLVYGPGVRANFESMMRWLARGVPLPLAAVVNNRRSLVAIDNLVDLIDTCLRHPQAAHRTFLVSDGEDLSTADLLRRLGRAMGRPARLFHVPTGLLELGAALLRQDAACRRLCGSLQVDIAPTREILGWAPPLSVDEGLRRAAEGFRA